MLVTSHFPSEGKKLLGLTVDLIRARRALWSSPSLILLFSLIQLFSLILLFSLIILFSVTLACSVTGSPTPTVAWYQHSFHHNLLSQVFHPNPKLSLVVSQTSLPSQSQGTKGGSAWQGRQPAPEALERPGLDFIWLASQRFLTKAFLSEVCLSEVLLI